MRFWRVYNKMIKYVKLADTYSWAIWEYEDDYSKQRCIDSSDDLFTKRNKFWNDNTNIVRRRIEYPEEYAGLDVIHLTEEEVFVEVL